MALVLALVAAVASAQSGISVTVNGNPVLFAGTGPQMVGGRVLVPLRGVFERLGASVQWVPAQRQVIATRGSDTVQLQIGNPSATVNGEGVTLDVPAEIVGGSTMVPIRFVSESIGAKVLWHEAEQRVEIIGGGAVSAPPPPPPAAPAEVSGGPVRMARVSFFDGEVSWRPGEDVSWSDTACNLPLRQGAQLWLNPGGRAEVQFDDGSMLRLGNDAIATLQTMYADSEGEFTEIRLNSGTASLRLTNSMSNYQVDTPIGSVTASGPARLRIDTTNGLRVVVRQGQAQVQGDAGQVTVVGGQYLSLNGPTSPYSVARAPGEDGWDRFCDQRDGFFRRSPYLPSSIAIVGGDLAAYGTWVNVPGYGHCWRPNGVNAGWAPYRDGHWVWVSPFGWTWCGSEPWGWAPYHYGTWVSAGGSWVWVPGPAQQYWSPTVVHFSTYNGAIAWCPLAPEEVRYPPAISIGFSAGNWAVNFSIGCAASYYPASRGYCAPHPWDNGAINRQTDMYNASRIGSVGAVYASNNGFVPRNSRVAGGATVAPAGRFGSGDHYARASTSDAQIFTKGKAFAARGGGSHFAGPTSVRPTAAAFSPTHSLSSAKPSAALLNRAVVRATLPAGAAAASKPMRNARVARPSATAPQTTRNRAAGPGAGRKSKTGRPQGGKTGAMEPGTATTGAPKRTPAKGGKSGRKRGVKGAPTAAVKSAAPVRTATSAPAPSKRPATRTRAAAKPATRAKSARQPAKGAGAKAPRRGGKGKKAGP